MYTKPGPFIRFGDIFEAPFLFSTYVRADASPLGMKDAPVKYSKQVDAAVDVPEGVDPATATFPVYSPNIHLQAKHDFVLAHGELNRAIILTDNCTIANLYGYDREKERRSGFVVMAAVRDETPEAIENSISKPTFNRFGLEASGFFSGGIVDFRKLVIVEKRDLNADQRVASLDKELAQLLEARWNAHIVRRGPNVVDRNAVKLNQLLLQAGVPDTDAEAAAAAVAETLHVAWRIEGDALDEAATAADDKLDPEAPVGNLVGELRELGQAALQAADALERARATT